MVGILPVFREASNVGLVFSWFRSKAFWPELRHFFFVLLEVVKINQPYSAHSLPLDKAFTHQVSQVVNSVGGVLHCFSKKNQVGHFSLSVGEISADYSGRVEFEKRRPYLIHFFGDFNVGEYAYVLFRGGDQS